MTVDFEPKAEHDDGEGAWLVAWDSGDVVDARSVMCESIVVGGEGINCEGGDRGS